MPRFVDLRKKLTIRFLLEISALGMLFWGAFVALDWVGVYVQQDKIREAILAVGIWGPLLYAFIYLLSVVIAPLPGFAAYIVAVGIYGVLKTVIFTYFLALVGATVNFLIARHLGRPIMRRLIGRRGEEKVDRHTENFGVEVLILTRLFDGFLFEWISYAAGLTNMKFKTYMGITVWSVIPYHIILFIFSARIHDLGKLFVTLSAVNYALLGVPIIYFFLKAHVFHKTVKL